MSSIEKKSKLLLSLVVFPLSFLATLIVVYLAFYGTELPFEVSMKTSVSKSKLLNVDDLRLYRATLLDSVRLLRGEIDTLTAEKNERINQINVWQDSMNFVSGKKGTLNDEIASLQSNVDQLTAQVEDIKLERMKRVIKILESINQEQVDSMYIAGLNDQILMDILAIAKEQQAAIILQQVRPSRAVKLLSQYINPRLQ